MPDFFVTVKSHSMNVTETVSLIRFEIGLLN